MQWIRHCDRGVEEGLTNEHTAVHRVADEPFVSVDGDDSAEARREVGRVSEEKTLIHWHRDPYHVHGSFRMPYFPDRSYITIYRSYCAGKHSWSGGLSNLTSDDLGDVERAEVQKLLDVYKEQIEALQKASSTLSQWLEKSVDPAFMESQLASMGENAADANAELRPVGMTYVQAGRM